MRGLRAEAWGPICEKALCWDPVFSELCTGAQSLLSSVLGPKVSKTFNWGQGFRELSPGAPVFDELCSGPQCSVSFVPEPSVCS